MKGLKILLCLLSVFVVVITTQDTSTSTETSPESTTYDNGKPPITDDPDCPDEGIVFIPDPENCTVFYECVDGDKYTFTCPGDLHFNPATNECDFPEVAGCEKPPVTNDYAYEVCQDIGAYFLVNPEDCSVYYECVEGNKYEHVCSPGLLFNLKTETCDLPQNVDCDAADD